MSKNSKNVNFVACIVSIILFGVLGFVVGYASRKQEKIECPKSVVNINEVMDGSEVNNDNKNESSQDNSYVNKENLNVDITKYLQHIVYHGNENQWTSNEIILNADGTAKWNTAGSDAGGVSYVGYYHFVSDNKIALSLFEKGYFKNYQCTNELFECHTSMILDYDVQNDTYKSDSNVTYKTVSQVDLKLLGE